MNCIHYIVQGYDAFDSTGNLEWMVRLDLIVPSGQEANEQDALDRAKTLVSKKYYRVSEVIEHDPDLEKTCQHSS